MSDKAKTRIEQFLEEMEEELGITCRDTWEQDREVRKTA